MVGHDLSPYELVWMHYADSILYLQLCLYLFTLLNEKEMTEIKNKLPDGVPTWQHLYEDVKEHIQKHPEFDSFRYEITLPLSVTTEQISTPIYDDRIVYVIDVNFLKARLYEEIEKRIKAISFDKYEMRSGFYYQLDIDNLLVPPKHIR